MKNSQPKNYAWLYKGVFIIMKKKIAKFIFFSALLISVSNSFAYNILYATVKGSEYDFHGEYTQLNRDNKTSKIFPLKKYSFKINALDFIYYPAVKKEDRFKNLDEYTLDISAYMKLLSFNKKTGEFKFLLYIDNTRIYPEYHGSDYVRRYIDPGSISGHLVDMNGKNPKFIIKGWFIDHHNGRYEIINSKDNEYFDIHIYPWNEKLIQLILKKDFPVIVKSND